MLLYKHRLNVALEYLAWVNSEVEGNFKIDPGPETFMVFLQTKGYLNEEKIPWQIRSIILLPIFLSA